MINNSAITVCTKIASAVTKGGSFQYKLTTVHMHMYKEEMVHVQRLHNIQLLANTCLVSGFHWVQNFPSLLSISLLGI